MKFEDNQFDIILAEGFLNNVGFQKGFLNLIKLLKRNRFLIIHDEFQNYDKKIEFMESNNCKGCTTNFPNHLMIKILLYVIFVNS